MSSTSPRTPDPCRFSISLPRPLSIGLAAVVVLVAGLGPFALAAAPEGPAAAVDDAKRPAAGNTEPRENGADALSPAEKQRRLRLRQIAKGYKANRAALTFGKCRISFAQHGAETLEDALAGKWIEQRQRPPFESTTCFRDDALVWKTTIDQQNFAKKGRFALSQNGNLAIAYSPRHFRFDDSFHPLDLAIDLGTGLPSLVSVIASAEASNFEGVQLTREEKVVRDGKEFLLLRKRTTADGDLDADFYVDRNRGYLPVLTEFFRKGSAEPSARQVLLDIRREGPIWFPLRALLVESRQTPDGKPGFAVRENQVLALEVAQRPSDDEMTIQFPARATFRNEGDANSEAMLFGRQDNEFATASVDEIEDIHRKLQDISAERKRTEPAHAAIYAFGWLISDTRRGRIRHEQFGGRTESGQLLYLCGNDAVQRELALDAEQINRLLGITEGFERDLVEELRGRGLSRPAIGELFGLGREERAAELRSINEKMPALEEKLCEKPFGALRELLAAPQFRRLQEIRWQLGGSRSLGDALLVEALGLTPAQQAEIKAVDAEHDERLLEYFSTDFSQAPDSDSPIYPIVITQAQKMSRERDAKALSVLSQKQREQLARLEGQPIDRAKLE